MCCLIAGQVFLRQAADFGESFPPTVPVLPGNLVLSVQVVRWLVAPELRERSFAAPVCMSGSAEVHAEAQQREALVPVRERFFAALPSV